LINQLMVGIHTQAVSEGLALGRKAGLDENALVGILLASFAQSRILDRHYNSFIAKDQFAAGFAIKLLSKDLDLVAQMAEQAGVRLPAGGRVRSLLQRATAGGYAGDDMSAMINYQLEQDAKAADAPVKHFAVFLPMK